VQQYKEKLERTQRLNTNYDVTAVPVLNDDMSSPGGMSRKHVIGEGLERICCGLI
jgi:hypothetical protein